MSLKNKGTFGNCIQGSRKILNERMDSKVTITLTLYTHQDIHRQNGSKRATRQARVTDIERVKGTKQQMGREKYEREDNRITITIHRLQGAHGGRPRERGREHRGNVIGGVRAKCRS